MRWFRGWSLGSVQRELVTLTDDLKSAKYGLKNLEQRMLLSSGNKKETKKNLELQRRVVRAYEEKIKDAQNEIKHLERYTLVEKDAAYRVVLEAVQELYAKKLAYLTKVFEGVKGGANMIVFELTAKEKALVLSALKADFPVQLMDTLAYEESAAFADLLEKIEALGDPVGCQREFKRTPDGGFSGRLKSWARVVDVFWVPNPNVKTKYAYTLQKRTASLPVR